MSVSVYVEADKIDAYAAERFVEKWDSENQDVWLVEVVKRQILKNIQSI